MKKIILFLLVFWSASAWAIKDMSVQGPSVTITNANVITAPVAVEFYWGCAVRSTWTGSALTGTVTLQASNDSATWDSVTNSTQNVSGPGGFMWNVMNVNYRYVRVSFTYTSGSGAIATLTNCKGSLGP